MPEITVSMAAGRTDEQKAGMMRDITQALVKNLGVDADAVVIQINEAPLAHKMKGGKTFVERAAREEVAGLHPSSLGGPITTEAVASRLEAPACGNIPTSGGYGSQLIAGMTVIIGNPPWTHATSSKSA